MDFRLEVEGSNLDYGRIFSFKSKAKDSLKSEASKIQIQLFHKPIVLAMIAIAI